MAAANKALLLLAILFAANLVAHAEWLDEELDDSTWDEVDEQDADDDEDQWAVPQRSLTTHADIKDNVKKAMTADPSGDTRYHAFNYAKLRKIITDGSGTKDGFHCTASGRKFRKGFAYSLRSTAPRVQWRVWAHQECERGAPTRVRVAYLTPGSGGQWMHITNTGGWSASNSWSSHPKLVNVGAEAQWTICNCPPERRPGGKVGTNRRG